MSGKIPNQKSLALARLKETIREARDCPAEEVISRLLKAVKDFSQGTKQKDDLTIVVIKRKKTIATLKMKSSRRTVTPWQYLHNPSRNG